MPGFFLGNTVTKQELEMVTDAVAMAISKAMEKQGGGNCGKCSLCLEPDFADKHKQHHDAISDLLYLLKRANDVKWGAIKAVFSSLALGLIMAFLWHFFKIKHPWQ